MSSSSCAINSMMLRLREAGALREALQLPPPREAYSRTYA
jgi:hypothetical protein